MRRLYRLVVVSAVALPTPHYHSLNLSVEWGDGQAQIPLSHILLLSFSPTHTANSLLCILKKNPISLEIHGGMLAISYSSVAGKDLFVRGVFFFWASQALLNMSVSIWFILKSAQGQFSFKDFNHHWLIGC